MAGDREIPSWHSYKDYEEIAPPTFLYGRRRARR
jgi:hypothetical protein